MSKTKKCIVCGEEKPLTSEYFRERKDSKDGYRNNCRKCSGKKAKKYIPPVGLKRCNICSRDLPANTDYFFIDNSREDGFQYKCKECKGYEFSNKVCKEGYKICQVCFQEKPMSEKYFRKRDEGKDGFNTRCKACESLYAIKWVNENEARHKAYRKKYCIENADIRRQNTQKRRARKKELLNTLTVKEWNMILKHFNKSCAYCGMTENEHVKQKRQVLHQEHFIPLSKGGEYTVNNIIPACENCNSSKGAKDFFEWYPTYEHYDKKKEKFILEYLGYTAENTQQLSIP